MNPLVQRLMDRAAGEVLEIVRFLGGVIAVWLVLVTFIFAAFHRLRENVLVHAPQAVLCANGTNTRDTRTERSSARGLMDYDSDSDTDKIAGEF